MGIEMEKNAYETKKSERPIWDIDESEVSLKSVNKGVEIPADLTCPICKDLLKVCTISWFTEEHSRMILNFFYSRAIEKD